eukprot:CAMPEP_0116103870 /NCGR_PEP_ID=MMETSP0327-20121206/14133_1 /TAXON_ID=44447 /ORGANISM="Pseudo-nitzschia delicatissima, Strain B596" /LENGTH=702 /DNA_ID=CAMNT_0003596045 /DNA_START=94 /DNA_END=2202 /DNA_ORIENTATION=+
MTTTSTRRTRTRTTIDMMPLLAILFLLSGTSEASVLQNALTTDPHDQLVSFPMIPHHVQRRRLGLSEDDFFRESSGGNSNRHLRKLAETFTDTTKEMMAGLYMGYGTHYVDLYCGTPPQRQTVIVDTGSSQTAFPCSECEDCGSEKYHTGPLFDESESSTFLSYDCDSCSMRSTCNEEQDRCDIEQYYSEGSYWTAYEAMDTCYIGGYHNQAILEDNGNQDNVDPAHAAAFGFDAMIGCQTEITGLFKTQLADGIMGMGDSKQAFWHQMFRSHKIRSKQFSLCYTRPPHALREGSEAGAVTLGGTDERLHDISPMVYTTLEGTSSELGDEEEKSGYYDIHVREMYLRDGSAGDLAQSAFKNAATIKLAGAAMINDEGGVIVDSGTTDTYFSTVIKKQLSNNWETLAGMGWTHDKLKLSPEEVHKLPTLLLQFAGDINMNKEVAEKHGGGDPNNVPGLAGDLDKNYPYDVVVAIPASHYMEAMSDGTVSNRLYATETDGSVLGANALIGHDVMFDAQNMRIGWAESSCDYFKLVRENGYTSAMDPFTESNSQMQKEDQEEEQQENEKEEYDQENAEDEIEQDNENIDEYKKSGGHVDSWRDTKIEFSIDDILDNPAAAGIGFAVVFFLGIFCVFKCCVPAAEKRRKKKSGNKEIEFGTRTRTYRDNFSDEEQSDDSDIDYAYGGDDDAYGFDGEEEYGEHKGL